MLQTEDRIFLKCFGVVVNSETFYNNHNYRIFFRIGKWRHRFARLDISCRNSEVRLFMCVEDASLLNNSALDIIIDKIKQRLETNPIYRIRFLVGDLSFIVFPACVDARIRPIKNISIFFLFGSFFVLLTLWLISMFIFAAILATLVLFFFLLAKWRGRRA